MMAEEKSMTYISADVSVGYHDLPLIEKSIFMWTGGKY